MRKIIANLLIIMICIGTLGGCEFVTVATEESAANLTETKVNNSKPQKEPVNEVKNKEVPVDITKEDNLKIEEEVEPEEPTNNETEENLKTIDRELLDTEDKSNETKSWSWKRNQEHTPPIAYTDLDLSKFDTYYLGDTTQKVIYLTFDEGYENGFTTTILNVLKENDVKAAFFVTQTYVRDNPELAKRMKEEGHVVGNHSVTHPSFPDLSDEELTYEIQETARYFKEVTGFVMDSFIRPPKGEYSERTLAFSKNLGWKSIFWSVAYQDWDTNNQPGADYAFNHVMENYHPGAIILLHAVSESNTQALDRIIKGLKEEGYRFASLKELN